jgi:peptidoglycan/LPS O-acetylase OafA/YrhL
VVRIARPRSSPKGHLAPPPTFSQHALFVVVGGRAVQVRAQGSEHIRQLTGLRFVAAAVVVLHHYGSFIPYPPGLSLVSSLGRPAVALFFLLSGLVLTYTYRNSIDTWASYRRYVRARLARLYPVYILALLPMTLVAIRTVEASGHEMIFVLSWITNVLLLQSFVPLQLVCSCGTVPGELNVPVLQLWNLPTWSISTELFFYLAFPAIAVVIGRLRTPAALAGAFLVLLIGEWLAFAAIVVYVAHTAPDNAHAAAVLFEAGYMWPVLRLAEFAMGCVVGWGLVHYKEGAPRWRLDLSGWSRPLVGFAVLGILGVAWLLGRVLLPEGDPPAVATLLLYAGRWHLGFVPLFAILLVGIAIGNNIATRFLGSSGMVTLGEASYALYALHFLSLAILRELRPILPISMVLASVVGMLTCVLVSLAVFRWVESPARRLLRGGRAVPRARSILDVGRAPVASTV